MGEDAGLGVRLGEHRAGHRREHEGFATAGRPDGQGVAVGLEGLQRALDQQTLAWTKQHGAPPLTAPSSGESALDCGWTLRAGLGRR